MSGENLSALGLGEWVVTTDSQITLACLGLGSCIGLCLYDPEAGVAGMAHMVLPQSPNNGFSARAAKFVDHAVPMILDEAYRLGAKRTGLKVGLVGGAKMVSLTVGEMDVLNIGERNITATLAALKIAGIKPSKSEVGGTRGRAVRLEVSTGRLWVTIHGEGPRDLWLGSKKFNLAEV